MDEAERRYPAFRFTLEEVSGAFGDSITVLPLLVGIGLTTEANLAHMLLFFGIFQLATGLFFKLPMPVEPMKALSALAIAGTLTYSGIVAAGIVLGVLLFLLGITGAMEYLDSIVPTAVVRGIQLGLASILLRTSVQYVSKNFALAAAGISIVLAFLFLSRKYSIPDLSAFVVLCLGTVYGIYISGPPPISLMELPRFHFPSLNLFGKIVLLGSLPQAALTIGNAVLATSLLFKDLLDVEVDPDRLCQSMGVMCLISSLFGGFPTCHGSGGLSGQYRFGARTGGSNIILGTVYLGIATIAGASGFLSFFPLSVLGALLIFVSLQLGLTSTETEDWPVTLAVAIVSFWTNIGFGFLAGMGLAKIVKFIRSSREK